MSNPTITIATAHRIAEKIADDIQDRCGLGNEWEQIDPETRRTILENWAEIIWEELRK